MGLDHELLKKTYVKNWEHNKDKKEYSVEVKKNGETLDHIDKENIVSVVEEIICWRKANAIHKWFVDNIQGGIDDCKEYYVSKGELKDLYNACVEILEKCELVEGEVTNGKSLANGKWVENKEKGKVLTNPEVAESILPTTDGFFFGGTDYDQWYMDDIKRTAEALEKVINTPDDFDVTYHYVSSW